MNIYPPGARIAGRYEVVGQPLKGGMGVVYLCYDIETGDPIALKTFQRQSYDANVVQRFRREALIWVELEKHPNIVQCYWVQELDHQLFIGMEMVTGSEGLGPGLHSWIVHRHLDVRKSLQLALDICLGMQHAQDEVPGLVHRDLKPENVLVSRDGQAKVTDFGLANAFGEGGTAVGEEGESEKMVERPTLTRVGVILGTPPYMSPEQCQGEPLDMRSDIYALGCVLYEMLTGRQVFSAQTAESFCTATWKRHLNRPQDGYYPCLTQWMRW